MTCVICKHGRTGLGTTTVTLERGGSMLIVRSVPAQVCETCGESYVERDVTERLLQTAEQAVQAGVQVEVRSYAAA